MTDTILFSAPAAPPVDRTEILRYARAGSGNAEISALLDGVLEEAAPTITYRAVYRVLPVAIAEGTVALGPLSFPSRSLADCLGNAKRVILVAATLGTGLDRLLLRYGRLSPARALLLQAFGTERIEALLDLLGTELTKAYGALTRRFSPGYGDLPLSLQRDILPLLDCERRLGITLGNSLLMSPSKSVTAVIGIKEVDL